MYIPGIVIFLVGSGQQRKMPGLYRGQSSAEGTVESCEHVVKRDRQGREAYNYYNILVSFRNPLTGQTERRAVKSPTEYCEAQQVRLLGLEPGGQLRISGPEEDMLFPPLALMTGGALLILLAFWENRGMESRAMSCLVLILVGAGILLLMRYAGLKRRDLRPVEAVIEDVYARQISKGTKILKGEKYTYYPVVRYNVEGKTGLLRLGVNSSSKKEFKPGDKITIYYDPGQHAVTERYASKGLLAGGILVLAAGLLALAGLIPALIG